MGIDRMTHRCAQLFVKVEIDVGKETCWTAIFCLCENSSSSPRVVSVVFASEVKADRHCRLVQMHRCRASYHGLPHIHSYRQRELPVCQTCEMVESVTMPDIHCCASPYYYDEPPCCQHSPYVEYACCDYLPPPPPPPVVQTNIHNDICYYLDEPDPIYDDQYGRPYRLSRSKVQLVDVVPRARAVKNAHPMVVSTFRPREHDSHERVMVPRSTVVRNTSLPSYERSRPRKLVPLYRSAEAQYTTARRPPSTVPELVPLATVAKSSSKQQTIRVRSLSPLN
jgi:hypothetical protein